MAQKRPCGLLVLAVAGWLHYLEGVDYNGQEYEIIDPRKERLQELILSEKGNPRPVLGEYEVFDQLGQNEYFASALEKALKLVKQAGPQAAINAYLSNEVA